MNVLYYLIFIVVMIYFVLKCLYAAAAHNKYLRKFFCKIGWHCYYDDYIFLDYDGKNYYCKCKWCSKEGILDDQGKLF